MGQEATKPGTESIPHAANRMGVSTPTFRKSLPELPIRVVRLGSRDRVVSADVDALIGPSDQAYDALAQVVQRIAGTR